MTSSIRKINNSLKLSNGLVEAVFSIDRCFKLDKFIDLGTGKTVCTQKEHILAFDREKEDLAVKGSVKFAKTSIRRIDDAYQNTGMEVVLFFRMLKSGLSIERHVFIYDGAPAIRIYDVYSSEKDLAGLYNSDILSIEFKMPFEARCVEFFTCTDQSNYRLIEKKAEFKNRAGFFITDSGAFLYKEGPMPDSQPIKGEYDFIYRKDSRIVSVTGLGFEKIRKGEKRRANGIVIGLTEDNSSLGGLKKYQQARYKINYGNDIEYLANSWPAFHLDVTEKKILKEIEAASRCGIKTVFIDDGWFDTFMGEIDKEKFPHGFDRISKFAASKGINVGLWMNPLGLDIKDKNAKEWDGAEAHDTFVEGNRWNWVARTNDFRYAEYLGSEGVRAYCAMDIMDKGYFEHIRDKILSLYRRYGIRRYKFDLYQLHLFDTLIGDPNRHYEKYRELLQVLKKDIPGLVISMDITRRNRPCFDFGMDFGRLFMENRGRNLKDHRYYHPYVSLRNLWYTAKYFPAQKMELEMMPQIDDYPIEYVLSTTIFANPLYWGSLADLPEEKVKRMKLFIDTLKPYKEEIMKGLVFPVGEMPEKGNWSGFISMRSETKGYLAVYRNGSKSGKYRLNTKLLSSRKYIFKDVFNSGSFIILDPGKMEFAIEEKFGFRLYRMEKANDS